MLTGSGRPCAGSETTNGMVGIVLFGNGIVAFDNLVVEEIKDK
jgi:hypothetical protein